MRTRPTFPIRHKKQNKMDLTLDDLLGREELEARPSLRGGDIHEDARMIFGKAKGQEEREEQLEWRRELARPMDPAIERIALMEENLELQARMFDRPKKKEPIKKKRKKQKTLFNYMPKIRKVASPKRPSPKKDKGEPKRRQSCPRNHQGFSERKCKFIPKVGKTCYLSPFYYSEWTEEDMEEVGGEDFCCDCKLEPCMVETLEDEMRSKTLDIVLSLADDMPQLERNRCLKGGVSEYIQGVMGEYFSKAYAKKHSPPPCVKAVLDRSFPTNFMASIKENSAFLDESDSDESTS